MTVESADRFVSDEGARIEFECAGGTASIQPLIPSPRRGWIGPAIGEWRLSPGATFGDEHPFDEINYVVEGRLIVHADGVECEAGPGEVVRVRAGHPATYYAPAGAKMIYVYGPNPHGLATRVLDLSEDERN